MRTSNYRYRAPKRIGQLVYWDSCNCEWLEGRSAERVCLIQMIDAASLRIFARFVRANSVEENVQVLREYLNQWGVPMAVSTNEASLFATAPRKSAGSGVVREMEPTRIGRALKDLGVVLFRTPERLRRAPPGILSPACARLLIAELRAAQVHSVEAANRYLLESFLPRFQPGIRRAMQDGHRPISSADNLENLGHRKFSRSVLPDRTFTFRYRRYQIVEPPVDLDLSGARIDLLVGPDSRLSAHFEGRALTFTDVVKVSEPIQLRERPPRIRRGPASPGQRRWMRNFWRRPRRYL